MVDRHSAADHSSSGAVRAPLMVVGVGENVWADNVCQKWPGVYSPGHFL
jgi:hypothetical protein